MELNEYDDEEVDVAPLESDGDEDDSAAKDEFSDTTTVATIDGDRLQASLDSVPTNDAMFRDLITRIRTLHQLYGDAHAHLALELGEIEMSLRAHVAFVRGDPAGWLISILATMPKGEAVGTIDDLMLCLGQRRSVLTTRGQN